MIGALVGSLGELGSWVGDVSFSSKCEVKDFFVHH
jgi:hypothetical protein